MPMPSLGAVENLVVGFDIESAVGKTIRRNSFQSHFRALLMKSQQILLVLGLKQRMGLGGIS